MASQPPRSYHALRKFFMRWLANLQEKIKHPAASTMILFMLRSVPCSGHVTLRIRSSWQATVGNRNWKQTLHAIIMLWHPRFEGAIHVVSSWSQNLFLVHSKNLTKNNGRSVSLTCRSCSCSQLGAQSAGHSFTHLKRVALSSPATRDSTFRSL